MEESGWWMTLRAAGLAALALSTARLPFSEYRILASSRSRACGKHWVGVIYMEGDPRKHQVGVRS